MGLPRHNLFPGDPRSGPRPPANADAVKKWAIDYFDATHPHSAGGGYVNFMMDGGQEQVQATYRDNYARLARIKEEYDPQNVFHLNQNIHPRS